MPELPEVETTRRGLEPHIVGETIVEVICRRHDLRFPIPTDIADVLEGARITKLKRRSKYLLFYTDKQQILISHLGMSGTWTLYEDEPEAWRKHDHLLVRFDNGMWMAFHDPRRFGVADLVREQDLDQHKLIKNLGPEPLTDNFTGNTLFDAIKHRTTPIKLAIMNAQIVVGVGNIYASESLFRAGIHPEKPCKKLSKPQCERLVRHIKEVLGSALMSGGSTLRDYVRSSGDSGYFQHQFQVYGRENEPCTVCNTQIKRIVQSNRSTFYCPNCQKS